MNGIAGRLAGAGDEGGRTVKRIVGLSVTSKCLALGDSRFDRLSKKRGFVVNAWEFSEVLLLDDEEEVDAAGLQGGEQLLKSRLEVLERTQRCEVVRAACMFVVVVWYQTQEQYIAAMAESRRLNHEGDRKGNGLRKISDELSFFRYILHTIYVRDDIENLNCVNDNLRY